MFSWQYASFLGLITAIIVAAPFADRQDWLGWAASIVTVVAAVIIVGTYFSGLVQTAKEWWYDELD